MDINTGHLVSPEKFEEMQKEVMRKLTKEIAEGSANGPLEDYQPVPKELEPAAKKKLASKDEAYVSLTSGGKLSRWAAKQRKAKRKAAKMSRRKNR